MEYKIGKYTLDVDVEATRAMYAAMPDHRIANSRELNFLRFISASERLLPYLRSMGIDPRKAISGFVSEGDARWQILYYSGSYPVRGTTDAPMEEARGGEDDEDEFQASELGLTLSIIHAADELSLYYEIAVPWLLSKPFLPTKYADRFTFPALEGGGYEPLS